MAIHFGIKNWELFTNMRNVEHDTYLERFKFTLFLRLTVSAVFAETKNPLKSAGNIYFFRKNYSAAACSVAGTSPSAVVSSSSSSSTAPPFRAVLDILTATMTALSGCMNV